MQTLRIRCQLTERSLINTSHFCNRVSILLYTPVLRSIPVQVSEKTDEARLKRLHLHRLSYRRHISNNIETLTIMKALRGLIGLGLARAAVVPLQQLLSDGETFVKQTPVCVESQNDSDNTTLRAEELVDPAFFGLDPSSKQWSGYIQFDAGRNLFFW